MKNSYIIKTIRRALLRQLIFPVLLLILSGVLMTSVSDTVSLGTLKLNQEDHFCDYPERSARVQTSELYYTGCDYTVNGTIKGHYYYTLIDDYCQFYILPRKGEEPADSVLYDRMVKGHLYRMAEAEYAQLLDRMAEDIGWTNSGIRAMSSPCAFSAVLRLEHIRLLLLPAAVLCFLIAAFDSGASLLYILFPLQSPTFRHLKKYGEIRVLLPKVEMEMRHTRMAKAGSIYLTPSYLINLDTVRTLILPLESVVRVYQHGHLRWFLGWLGKRPRISHSLYVITDDGKIYEFEKKKKDDLTYILKILERRYPHISLGYHE